MSLIIIKSTFVILFVAFFSKRLPALVRKHFAFQFLILLIHSNIISLVALGYANIWMVRASFSAGALACCAMLFFLHRVFYFDSRKQLWLLLAPPAAMIVLSFTPFVTSGVDVAANSVPGFLRIPYIASLGGAFLVYFASFILDARKSSGLEKFQKVRITAWYIVTTFLIFASNLIFPLWTGKSTYSWLGAFWFLIPTLACWYVIVASKTIDLSIADEEIEPLGLRGMSEVDFVRALKDVVSHSRRLILSGRGSARVWIAPDQSIKFEYWDPDRNLEEALAGKIPANLIAGQQSHLAQLERDNFRLAFQYEAMKRAAASIEGQSAPVVGSQALLSSPETEEIDSLLSTMRDLKEIIEIEDVLPEFFKLRDILAFVAGEDVLTLLGEGILLRVPGRGLRLDRNESRMKLIELVQEIAALEKKVSA